MKKTKISFLLVFICCFTFSSSGCNRCSGDPKSITNSIGMTFNYIEPGTFMMGSPEDKPDRLSEDEITMLYISGIRFDETQHEVTLTEGYYMQTTPVTVGQWRTFIQDTGYKTEAETGDGARVWTVDNVRTKAGYYWARPGFSQTDSHPVTCVSWNDVQKYIAWLNRKESSNYRLPTEAQWEYAARAGTTTPFYFGRCLSTDQANYDGNYPLADCPKGDFREKTTPVKMFPANAWGLYDMHGNVFEWVADWYGSYPSSAVTDPTGPSSGTSRITRGGCWIYDAWYCRSAYRNYDLPGSRYNSHGFRLVLLPGH